ncbi:hypothetical protein PHYPSEUDO_001292 [Phytophthora pseudosyringae]|uniref:Uncharacterized protein n=1 Tax=Phytophthora pseudosyringae TaxID=221518 RepID=A0A8T1VW51_9STRA|nr:hypothetical protein PHYPSEUDO_001292 [Phytophthora pseudosyringae]
METVLFPTVPRLLMNPHTESEASSAEFVREFRQGGSGAAAAAPAAAIASGCVAALWWHTNHPKMSVRGQSKLQMQPNSPFHGAGTASGGGGAATAAGASRVSSQR